MNINKALWLVCGTLVLVVILLASLPERTTSNERILTQPERTTSMERVETNRILTAERVIIKQNSTFETISSNNLYLQTQQKIAAEVTRSNYFIAKSELATAWISKLEEVKPKGQNAITLAHIELSAQIASKYNISLDSEPPVPVSPSPVIIRKSPASTYTFPSTHGLSQTKAAPVYTVPRSSVNLSLLASLELQYQQMEQQMWALERQGKGYARQPDNTVMFCKNGRWVKVDASSYDPSYDAIRRPKDALLIRIQAMKRQ